MPPTKELILHRIYIRLQLKPIRLMTPFQRDLIIYDKTVDAWIG